MVQRLILFLLLSLVLLSCGTYRTAEYHKPGYSGLGDYRNPSDYTLSTDSGDESLTEQQQAREHLGPPRIYEPQSSFKLYWPVQSVQINRGFQPSSDRRHEGVDLGGTLGTPILAAHEGVVIYVGNGFNGYGNMILLEYNREWATLYGHLNSFSVREGAIVEPGTQLGTMGATGHATGVHLHFELLHNRQPTDPLQMLTKPVKFATNKKKPRQIR